MNTHRTLLVLMFVCVVLSSCEVTLESIGSFKCADPNADSTLPGLRSPKACPEGYWCNAYNDCVAGTPTSINLDSSQCSTIDKIEMTQAKVVSAGFNASTQTTFSTWYDVGPSVSSSGARLLRWTIDLEVNHSNMLVLPYDTDLPDPTNRVRLALRGDNAKSFRPQTEFAKFTVVRADRAQAGRIVGSAIIIPLRFNEWDEALNAPKVRGGCQVVKDFEPWNTGWPTDGGVIPP